MATLKKDSKKRLEQITFTNTPKGITDFIKHLKNNYNDNMRAVCESTANYWIQLHDTLEENGIDTILAHPTKTKIIAQARLKDDKVDSDILADLLRTDMIYESFVPDKHYRDLRNLVRTRLGLIRDMSRHKNIIHAIVAKYDYTTPTKNAFSKIALQKMKNIKMSDADKMAFDVHLDNIEMFQTQVHKYEIKIASISSKDDRTKILMTMPGISFVSALTIISEIVDIHRFKTPEKLVAYSGLAPSHRDSADVHRGGPITKQGSVWLRNAMVEAATTTVQHDFRIKSFYNRISKNKGQKAIVAAARQMLYTIWYMLTNMEEYRTQDSELTQRKFKRMNDVSKSS